MRALVVHEVLSTAARSRGGVSDGVQQLTYEHLYRTTLRLADSLSKRGVGRGSVLAVMDVNSVRHLMLHYASSMLGAVILTVNFRLAPDDMRFAIRHAEADWLFVWEGFAPAAGALRAAFPHHWVWLTDGPDSPESSAPSLEELVAAGAERVPEEARAVHEADPFSIFYTTGTTGRPKGLRYRHRDMLLASLGIVNHLALHRGGASCTADDVFMPAIPFFHIHGWGTVLSVPHLGATLVLPGRAGPAEQLALIQRERVTWTNMVPTQVHMLLDQADAEGAGLSGLKILTGGSPLPSGLVKRLRERGIAFSLIYGGSDQLATSISVVPPGVDPASEEAANALSTDTLPLAMVDVRLEDDAGQAVPADGLRIGRLSVRSPWLPEGYFRDPALSAEAYEHGWFKTGDLARLTPGGALYIVDREGDAVKSGGEWVATGVLEALISEHPAVAAVAVVPRADPRWGTRPVAVVQPRGPVTPEHLRSHLHGAVEAGALARYWIPDAFVFVDALPLTSAGKVDKSALRRMVSPPP